MPACSCELRASPRIIRLRRTPPVCRSTSLHFTTASRASLPGLLGAFEPPGDHVMLVRIESILRRLRSEVGRVGIVRLMCRETRRIRFPHGELGSLVAPFEAPAILTLVCCAQVTASVLQSSSTGLFMVSMRKAAGFFRHARALEAPA